jgi:hypothetical protein
MTQESIIKINLIVCFYGLVYCWVFGMLAKEAYQDKPDIKQLIIPILLIIIIILTVSYVIHEHK